MNKQDMEKLKKKIANAAKPAPVPSSTSFRNRVKERFYRRLEEQSHIWDKEAVMNKPDIMTQLAGTDRIHTWLQDPKFAEWWWDEYIIADELMALRNESVGKLKEILTGEDVAAGDILKAARMVFELTDQFPSKKQEVIFADKELNNMTLPETEGEIRRLQGMVDDD